MKKLFVVGATATLLLMTATTPAFADTLATDRDDDVGRSQFGEATADASGESSAAADVSRSQGFTFEQANSALNDF